MTTQLTVRVVRSIHNTPLMVLNGGPFITYHRRVARRLGLIGQRQRQPKVERDRFGFPLDAKPLAGAA